MTINPKQVTGIEAKYLDCCMPCYFSGSNAEEVLAIPVWQEMTYKEDYEALKDEFYTQDGFFTDVDDCMNMAYGALHSMFACLLPEDVDKPADFAKYAPSIDDEIDESPYLYVGLFAEID